MLGFSAYELGIIAGILSVLGCGAGVVVLLIWLGTRKH